MVKKVKIEDVMDNLDNFLIIDTRSPKEYTEDHIQGAINLPILENKERHEVGKLYKKDNDAGIKFAYKLYHKKLPSLKEKINALEKDKEILIYCFRGGLRSKTITELFCSMGHNAVQLDGGYKSYRRFILDKLYNMTPSFKFIVVYGLAGSGKTDIIKKIKPSIDLEGLAAHRSSLFGALGLKPTSQKFFESKLYDNIISLKDEDYVFVEGESMKIGDIMIPKNIFAHINDGVKIRINTSIKKRVKIIVRDYFTHKEDEKIKKILNTLRQAMSNEVVDSMLKAMEEKDYEFVAKELLEKYYDSKYEYFMKDFKFKHFIDGDDTEKAVEELEKIKEGL